MGYKKKFWLILDNEGIRGFSLLYAFFLFIGLILIIVFGHGDIVLFINKYSREGWDRVANVLSIIGYGSFIAGFWILIALFNIRYTLMGLFNLGLVGIFTGVLKKIFFEGIPRPLSYFNTEDFFRMVDTNEINHLNSFPSGHAMTIFAATFLLAYFSGKRWTGIFLFVVALMVGFSRIYLLQHFFIDVYVGSIIGLITAFLTIWIGDILFVLNQRNHLQKPLYRIVKFRKLNFK